MQGESLLPLTMLIRLNATLRRVPRWIVLTGSLAYTALVAWIDVRAGAGLDLAVFYLPAIAAVSWYLGRAAGTALALVATTIGAVVSLALRPPGFDREMLLWNSAAQFLFFLFAAMLVAVLEQQTVRLRTLAREDPLTGIANRRAFFGALDRAMEWSRRQGMSWALAYVDVDNFKKLNDTQGHGAGDGVLRKVARTLREGIRRVDIVARLGGDEFALLLPETDADAAETIVSKLQLQLDQAMAEDGWDVSFSIGVMTFTVPPESLDAAVAMADACMYRAKARGKAGAVFRVWPEQAALELPLGVAAVTRSGSG